MSSKFTELVDKVARAHGVVDSTLVLCEELAVQFRAVADDPFEVYALANELTNRRLEAAEAVAANQEAELSAVERAKADRIALDVETAKTSDDLQPKAEVARPASNKKKS
jgi:hypothetical protein